MTYDFDPELAASAASLPSTDFADVAATRRAFDELLAAASLTVDTTGLAVTDRMIPGAEGDPDVRVRVYTPDPAPGAVPAVCFIHGGGFVIGSVDSEHGSSAALAQQLGVVVVSVDYRLAPEHPYPAGLEDCYAALRWMHDDAVELGIDIGRVGVVGGSAGGGLAAGLALLARDRGGPPLCFQFLSVPELDDRLETPSMTQFTDTPVFHRENAMWSWRHYLAGIEGPVPPYAAPARAADLSGLPPAYVSTMQFDPLRDEGIGYALRMLQAGVPVELHQYPRTFHGSALVESAAVSRRAQAERIEVLRRGLGLLPDPN